MAKKKVTHTKSTVGRPSDYDPKYVQMLLDYFDIKPYQEKTKKVLTGGALVEIPFSEASDFPTLAGFAVKIGKHRDTLHRWSEEHPEFSDAYKRAKDFQENYLAVNGNKGLIAPAFAIFTAKNVLGWRDKQPGEADVIVNNNVSNLSDAELEARVQEKLSKLSGTGE